MSDTNLNPNLDGLNPAAPDLGNDTSSFYELEVAPGKRERFTNEQLNEFYKGNLRLQDYTRKTQELSEQRKQVEQFVPVYQQLVQEREQIAQFLKDKALVAKYLKDTFPDEPTPDDLSKPVDLRTLKDTEARREAALQRQIQDLQQQLQQSHSRGREEVSQEIQRQIETAQYAQEFNGHFSKVLTDNPVLSLVDNAEEILRYKVYQANPQNMGEAKKLIDKFATEQVAKITAHFGTQAAPASPEKQPSKKSSIEPPGGAAAPAPQANSFKRKDGTTDWDLVNAAAEEALKKMQK